MSKKYLLIALLLDSCLPFDFDHGPPRLFSDSYVECDMSFYWNSPAFHTDSSFLSSNKIDRDIGISTEILLRPNGRSGSVRSMRGKLSQADQHFCDQIYQKVGGFSSGKVGISIEQYFSTSLINQIEGSSYQELDAGMAKIIQYNWKEENGLKVFSGIFELPLSVECQNKWAIRKNNASGSELSFKQPDGRCNFILTDHKIELSGQQVIIAIKGFYEKNPDRAKTEVLVSIERFGFKFPSKF